MREKDDTEKKALSSYYKRKFKPSVSKSRSNMGLVAPWDILEEDKSDHFANYYAWEKWLQMQDRKDSLENLNMMEKTLLYAIMVDLLKGNKSALSNGL